MTTIPFTLEGVKNYIERENIDISANNVVEITRKNISIGSGNSQLNTILSAACVFHSHIDIVKYLLDKDAGVCLKSIINAVDYHNYSTAKCLIDDIYNPNKADIYFSRPQYSYNDRPHVFVIEALTRSFHTHTIASYNLINYIVSKIHTSANLSYRDFMKISKLLSRFLIDDLAAIVMDYVTQG